MSRASPDQLADVAGPLAARSGEAYGIGLRGSVAVLLGIAGPLGLTMISLVDGRRELARLSVGEGLVPGATIWSMLTVGDWGGKGQHRRPTQGSPRVA